MPTLNVDLTEDLEKAKLQWLRAAARESFESIDRAEGTEFQSADDLATFIDRLAVNLVILSEQRESKDPETSRPARIA